jgi:hypothetical protein
VISKQQKRPRFSESMCHIASGVRWPLWVFLDQVIELGLRGDVRFDPNSDHDRTALRYVAKGQ